MANGDPQTTPEQIMPGIVACALRALQLNGEVKTYQPIVMPHDVQISDYILNELRCAGFRIVEENANAR